MRPAHLVRAASVITASGALLLVLGPLVPAFTTVGHTLGIGQRDVRVYDNFGAPAGTPDPNWPGATGAPLAVWKAVAEWGSELHGDGSGDPSQPNGVGSGGANFDAVWQGLAPNAGTETSNVVSMMSGCDGGVYSSTDLGSFGWRIRFSDCIAWNFGPGTGLGTGEIDLQGVMCHEYGHVLGLGHTTVAGSTMLASITGNGSAQRSIEADDMAGIRFLYGVQAPTKPHVASISGTDVLTITGAHFAPTGNEVWLTQAVLNPTGEPVKVGGLPSTAGGTQIVVGLPALAGPGDLLVHVPGSGGDTLSNAFPFDPSGCGAPASYCEAKLNSQGCLPLITSTGQPSASSPMPFLIEAGNVINQKSGLLLYAYAPGASTFQGGTLCLSGSLRRTPAQSTGGNLGPADCSGTLSFDFNARIQSGIDPALVVGTHVYAQYYYRDPADSFGVGLTDALAFEVCP
jgi:hypothetical protein